MEFDRKKVLLLRQRYERAVQEGEKQFTFDGEELLTAYAKYMLEYLERQFK